MISKVLSSLGFFLWFLSLLVYIKDNYTGDIFTWSYHVHAFYCGSIYFVCSDICISLLSSSHSLLILRQRTCTIIIPSLNFLKNLSFSYCFIYLKADDSNKIQFILIWKHIWQMDSVRKSFFYLNCTKKSSEMQWQHL